MSKKVSFIIIAVILVLALVIPSNKVFAANKKVNEVNAVQNAGKITVSGTVENGMLAVAIQVVDSNGKLVTLETGDVDVNNKFNLVIEVPEGTYIVKVADYEGGEVVEKTVPKTEEKTTEETKADDKTTDTTKENEAKTETKTEGAKKTDETTSPQTGDTIRNIIITLIAAIIVLALTFKFKKNKCLRKH
ncbi:MAG: LPXTG cell wall anchor domain-containing protein [Clostridia bacterium]|nr:LPXTG cell wall anchor domain-containing protein [Clostridia bacterium]